MALYRRLFIDFDSFYASVEQQDNEIYQNKSLIVVPCISDYTCAIAASYQAKRLGVKTGTRVKTAKEKIPGLFVVEARPKRYVEVHNQILEVLSKHFKKIQVLSIDEMACEIEEDDDFDCEMIAADLKLDLMDVLGDHISCSIGVAQNVFLSKVAADMNKPNGFTALGDEAAEQLKKLIGTTQNGYDQFGHKHEGALITDVKEYDKKLCVVIDDDYFLPIEKFFENFTEVTTVI